MRVILERETDIYRIVNGEVFAGEAGFFLSKGETVKVNGANLIVTIVASPTYPGWAIASLQERVTPLGLISLREVRPAERARIGEKLCLDRSRVKVVVRDYTSHHAAAKALLASPRGKERLGGEVIRKSKTGRIRPFPAALPCHRDSK